MYNHSEVIVLTLTEKLDLLMAEKKINRSQLAVQSGVPYTTIVSLYEKGSDNVKRSTLLALSRFFDVSLDYLADDSVEERKPQILGAAAHFDVSKLTPEGLSQYEAFMQYLADKYTKE